MTEDGGGKGMVGWGWGGVGIEVGEGMVGDVGGGRDGGGKVCVVEGGRG